jgi:hypothetical protein
MAPESREQFLDRLNADLSGRWARGERVPVEKYLTEHPDLSTDSAAIFSLIQTEIHLREVSAQPPSLAEYLARFPGHSEALRAFWVARGLALHPGTLLEGEMPTVASASLYRDRPVLAGLELETEIGAGGMGVVYRGRQAASQRPCAIKVIRAGFPAGSDFHARFVQEIRALQRLDHPGIVRIYASEAAGDRLYICMELLAGSLQARLRKGRLELREAVNLVRQVALAVQHAHDRGILHRDLKPANVLLTEEGTPKVSDFGLAKFLDSDFDLTLTGELMGTPVYMAPEQAASTKRVGPRADVYALGAILYECLTGQPPFQGTSRSDVLTQVKLRLPRAPRRLRGEIPPELEAICLRCLEKRPELRYGSAAELAADLQAWLDGKPARTRPVRGLGLLWLQLRRRPEWTLVGALLLLATVTGWFLASAREGPGQEHREEPVGALPPGARWWLGSQLAGAEVGPDGAFAVHGWPLTLLELKAGTGGHQHYRLEIEIRHRQGGEGGNVGLFFAGSEFPAQPVPLLTFLAVHYDDLHDFVELYRRFAPEVRAQRPEPLGNPVYVESRYVADGAPPARLTHSTGIFAPELFKPGGTGRMAGPWRTLRVDVSPTRVSIYWDGLVVGTVAVEELEKRMQADLENLRQAWPKNPVLVDLKTRLDLTGKIGLYLFESHVSFRNFRFAPLAAEEGN